MDDIVTSASDRSKLLVWKEAVADVEGCFLLEDPLPLAPLCELRDKSCPVLCLLDELEHQGWLPVGRLTVHRKGGPKEFDSRDLPS